ncbi:phytoene desaturase family protein [Actinopolyspora saharensis]|uniref:phytoene desaturase family protein n=1 Tax=Actinopolyspora saharensis TaxID=995062 RepID=UPI003F67F7C6
MDAVVVGSGPNGLAAALVLAKAGLQVRVYESATTLGGGARTTELTLRGFQHDVCSAVHPLGMASPFFQAFDLAAHGVEMLAPEVSYAHPLDGGGAGVAWRDFDRTADGLGKDGASWRRLLGPLIHDRKKLIDVALSDLRHVPFTPATALRLGTRVLEQGSPLARLRFRNAAASAMFAGVGAHSLTAPQAPAPAGVGLVLAALAHTVGWPLPRGGSQAITNALESELRRLGVDFVTGHTVESLAELSHSRTVLLDLAPNGLLRLAGDTLPSRYARQLRSFRHGSGACKVDFALSGPVPWTADGCDLAGTLHLGGSRDEIISAEKEVASGRHPERPYVLAVQPGVVDGTRAPRGQHTLWTYAHVPHGSSVDVSESIKSQVERFAPGFRDLIRASHVVTAAEQYSYNANYVGGDISGGALTAWQVAMRPTPRLDPYATPFPGVYLCSSSTPPGTGVHGMSGVHAARRVLRKHFGITTNPIDLVRGTC